MAKTYNEWEDEAKKSGLYDTFSDKDLEIIKTDTAYGDRQLDRKKQYNAATTQEEKDKIASDANYDRLNYGYYNTVEGDGNGGYRAVSHTSGGSSPKYSGALAAIKAYDDSLPGDKSSKYMTAIDNLFSKIAGEKFSYDAKSDPRYALAEEYARKAMENQMAESALLTGGYGNSYAAHAGQQVYTDYMNDAVNDMEDRAYAKWAAERDNNYNLLGIIQGLEQQAYNRAENERQWQYQLQQDAKEDAENKKTNAQNTVYDYIRINGSVDGLSEEELAATGWSSAYIEALVTEAKKTKTDEATAAGVPEFSADVALKYYVGGNKSSKVLEAMQYHFGDDYAENADSYYKNMIALNNAASSGNPVKEYEPPLSYTTAYKQYMEGDYSGAVMETLNFYDFKFEEEEETVLPETVYSDAMNYLAGEGVSPAYTGMLIHPTEFEKSLKKYGSAVAEIDGRQITFYSYDEYVDKFAEVYGGKKAPDNGDGVAIMSPSQFEAKKRGGSVSFNGKVFDSYEDYKRYMEEEYAYEV